MGMSIVFWYAAVLSTSASFVQAIESNTRAELEDNSTQPTFLISSGVNATRPTISVSSMDNATLSTISVSSMVSTTRPTIYVSSMDNVRLTTISMPSEYNVTAITASSEDNVSWSTIPIFSEVSVTQNALSTSSVDNAVRSTPSVSSEDRMNFVQQLLNRHNQDEDVEDGTVRLVDGRTEYEGTVEIYHKGSWGNICDDEWDMREGEVVCKSLGFRKAKKVTYSAHFGRVRHKYWLDNMYCFGTERSLGDCRNDGWGVHDCEKDEAAGVICEAQEGTSESPSINVQIELKDETPPVEQTVPLLSSLVSSMKIRLKGGRIEEEGRVEIQLKDSKTWGVVCGSDWSLFEAMVVCRHLGFKFAQSAHSTDYFGGNTSSILLNTVKCSGNENYLLECRGNSSENACPGSPGNIAAVTCTQQMADLVPDYYELSRSVHLEDKPLFFLQCALEENCLASHAYELQKSGYGWHLEARRLLRFTARIANQGDAPFRPFLPKTNWEWHACHMHYHSMEVFAYYDITDQNGTKVAEGHKASFCLEDNNCQPNVEPKFKCANFGDQGISPGCTDTYAYNIDCQWIDITEMKPGNYIFKLEINPEFKVAEQSFDNNAAVCELIYSGFSAWIGNCSLSRPGTDVSILI